MTWQVTWEFSTKEDAEAAARPHGTVAKKRDGKSGPSTEADRHYGIIRAAGERLRRRFAAQVNLDGPDSRLGKCHLWTGPQTWSSGDAPSERYGKIGVSAGGRKMTVRAHRVAWMLHHGRAATGLVRHMCHNRLCVNPEHLAIGSNSDNMRDAASRGERPRDRPPRRPMGDIGPDERAAIRAAAAAGVSRKELRRRHRTTNFVIYDIIGRLQR